MGSMVKTTLKMNAKGAGIIFDVDWSLAVSDLTNMRMRPDLQYMAGQPNWISADLECTHSDQQNLKMFLL